MTHSSNFALALLALSAAAASAQHPNLGGTWSAVPGQLPTTLPQAPGPVLGSKFSLTFERDSVTLRRQTGDASLAITFPLDGHRVVYPVPGQLCEGERHFHETASWEDEALVLTSVGYTPAGGGALVEAPSRRILRLAGPDQLVVEGTMVQGGQRKQVGYVYKKTNEVLPPARAPHPLKGTAATIARVAWIGARWEGTSSGVTTEERWTPPASGGLIGVSRTLRGAALTAFEFLCIVERGGSLAYLAMPGARSPATVFMATEVTPTSVTFENPAHDYPKMIRYAQTAEGDLETTVAGANGTRAQKVVLKKSAP